MTTTDAAKFHEELVARLSAATCADIEGIDPLSAGFCRGACELGIPDEERNSFGRIKKHVLVSTALKPTQWTGHCDNVDELQAVEAAFAGDKSVKVTAVYVPADVTPFTVVIDKTTTEGRRARVLEYTGGVRGERGELPEARKGVIVADRSAETFVLVCAHRERDARCGYCGAILVELLRSTFAAKLGEDAAKRIRVLPCSHVGGHAYAGNVLVYGSGGGVGFGALAPRDLDELTDFIAAFGSASSGGDVAVPAALETKLRGKMFGFA